MWEIRVFTGRDAKRVAAQLESQPTSAAAGRTVSDVLDAWREVNDGVWSAASKRDYASRAAFVADDPIGRVAIARLGVGDVERWHSRMRRLDVGESAIRGRHSVLRAALAQAVRWGWVGTNVAAAARLRHGKRQARESMTADEVRAVIAAAESIDPAAGLALRLAAVAGARRSEIAALRWDDFDPESGRLRIDSNISVVRDGERGGPTLLDAPTKTGDLRSVHLDEVTIEAFEKQRAERGEIGPYLFSLTLEPPNPDRIRWWWQCARDRSSIDRK